MAGRDATMKPASQLDPIQLANLQFESVMTPRRGLLGDVQRDIRDGNVQGLLDTAALSTSALPGAGDVAGLLSDGYSIANEGANIGNVGGALLGALPFVPAGMGRKLYPIASRDEWLSGYDYQSRGGKLVEMSPDDFLKDAAPLKMDELARESVDDLKRHIQEGGELDPLEIFGPKSGGARNSDGRHRAIAAKELGIDSVPVLDFRDVPSL